MKVKKSELVALIEEVLNEKNIPINKSEAVKRPPKFKAYAPEYSKKEVITNMQDAKTSISMVSSIQDFSPEVRRQAKIVNKALAALMVLVKKEKVGMRN